MHRVSNFINWKGEFFIQIEFFHRWGQVFILNSLSKYRADDSRDAENICERVAPRLNHANSAVVLAAIKVMMVMMDQIKSPELVKALCKKMAPPLGTILLLRF